MESGIIVKALKNIQNMEHTSIPDTTKPGYDTQQVVSEGLRTNNHVTPLNYREARLTEYGKAVVIFSIFQHDMFATKMYHISQRQGKEHDLRHARGAGSVFEVFLRSTKSTTIA